jgi:hypothetical protein
VSDELDGFHADKLNESWRIAEKIVGCNPNRNKGVPDGWVTQFS